MMMMIIIIDIIYKILYRETFHNINKKTLKYKHWPYSCYPVFARTLGLMGYKQYHVAF